MKVYNLVARIKDHESSLTHIDSFETYGDAEDYMLEKFDYVVIAPPDASDLWIYDSYLEPSKGRCRQFRGRFHHALQTHEVRIAIIENDLK